MKSILLSKTFWVNGAVALLGILDQMGLVNVLPQPYGPALAMVFGAVNLVLRSITTEPVKVPGLPSGGIQPPA